MLKSIEYSAENEIESLKIFLTEVSNGVKHVFFDTDFREFFPKSEYYNWELFEKAFNSSHEQFLGRLNYLERDESPFLFFYWRNTDAFTQTGFNGPSLEFKIAFWNGLVSQYNAIWATAGNRFETLKKIIKAVLDFCNIILESGKFLTGNDSLKEMKELGEWIITNSLDL